MGLWLMRGLERDGTAYLSPTEGLFLYVGTFIAFFLFCRLISTIGSFRVPCRR
ncbi:MAG: hypothetical protein UX81_C0005G0030 [Parcubacteria group bacterium GW2011_GWA2_47_12]|nr:MAG: hypothetical protein UX81_C0005G0030 [Parcubacteria group bacterium GW2011_GWA2_47_12]